VIGGGVGAHQHDAIGLLEAFQAHHRSARAEHLTQTHGGGGVAEVGAIGQVVGTQCPQQQLQQVGGLVGGAARAVGGQPLWRHFEGLLGEFKDLVPADRLVTAAALPQDQRLAQSPQPVSLQGAELLQLGDAALAEQPLGHGGL
jgi:hypothetical protein